MRKAIIFTLFAGMVNAGLLVVAAVFLQIHSGLGLTMTAWFGQILVGLTTIFIRSIFKEGWEDSGFTKPQLRWFIYAWSSALLFFAATMMIGVLFHAASLHLSLSSISAASHFLGFFPLPASGKAVVYYTFFATLILPVILAIFAFGEEIGWRGYVLPKLLKGMGERKALLYSGLLWSTWHWPLIWAGQAYVGFPVLGTLMIIPIITFVGVYLGYLRLRTNNVWVTALAHGTLNAQMGGIFILLAPPKNTLLGGFMGLAGIVVMLIVSMFLFYLLSLKRG